MALGAPVRLQAALNLRYEDKVEKVHWSLGDSMGAGRCERQDTYGLDGRDAGPPWAGVALRGEDVAQFSSQDLAGGRSWQHIHEMDLTWLLVGGEPLGYKSAEVLF